MSTWSVPPRPVRIALAGGEWIDVKAQLNHGEHNGILERCYVTTPDGDLQRHPFKLMHAIITAYLIDWSATDLPILGASPDVIDLALQQISQEKFLEVQTAVEAHAAQLERERLEKKTAPAGASAS